MISAIAIDDEPVALDIIRMHAQHVPFITLRQTFTSARAALNYLAAERIDLVFLDINMPDIGGFDFAARVDPAIQLIVTTAHSDHAIAGYDLAITDFLLKPINCARFLKACTLAQHRTKTVYETGTAASENLFLKDGYNWVRINIQHLLYIKAEDNYVSFYQKQHHTMVRMTLQEALLKLGEHSFMRVHKSYVVNANRIEKFDNQHVFIDGIAIPVSKTFIADIKRKLL